MKIAFFTYPSAFQNIGGGEILLLKLKEYLEKEGQEVDLFDSWSAKMESYDFLHVFGSVKDCLGLVRVANVRKVKVAITPLLWSDARRALFTEGSLLTKADFVARHVAKWVFPWFPSSRRKLLLHSDLIFPNSNTELKQIARMFSIPIGKMRVVYNGVDKEFAKADPVLFRACHGREPFVLGVGRVEPRKNQLNLIRAVKRIKDKKLFLIGSPVSGFEDYFHKCQEEGAGFVTFLPTLKHDDPLLASAYAACELFVLPGWFETPGLVAMEAALAGARIIATDGGSTREYFKDHVDYFNPANPLDIQGQVMRTLRKPKTDALGKHVLENFTWDKIARSTVCSYEEFLKP